MRAPRCCGYDLLMTMATAAAAVTFAAVTVGTTTTTSERPVQVQVAPTGVANMAGVQLLYNNDGENLWAVSSPYHEGGAPITAATIQGSVREVAGIADVDLICPFHNVPWWVTANHNNTSQTSNLASSDSTLTRA